jgi:hypothetical protein
LRVTFKVERDGVTGEFRKLYNKEFNYIYSSPNIIRVIKSGIMSWAGHVARMGERRGLYRLWWETLRAIHYLGDAGVDGMKILRWIVRKWNVGAWTGFIWLRIGTVSGHL